MAAPHHDGQRRSGLRCSFIEDAPDYIDRAEDAYEPMGGSLSGIFETARDAWVTAVEGGEMSRQDWDGDSDAAVDDADGHDMADLQEAMNGDTSDGPTTRPQTRPPTRRAGSQPRLRRRRVDLSKYASDSTSADNRTRRQPAVGTTPLTVEELHADFAAELRVALMVTARMDNVNDRPSVEPQCVSGARVLVFVELFDPVCVWSASERGLLVTYCSCGGVLGSGRRSFTGEKIEHVNVQVARRKSSTCRHASALQMAYNGLAAEHEMTSLDELLEAFPALAGDDEDLAADVHADTAVHLALLAGKKANVPILAVSYEGIWSPAIVRRQGNKHKLATCFLLSCASHPWGCIHAQAVNEHNRLETAASSAAAAELQESLKFGPSGYLDDGDEDQNDDGDDQPGGEPGSPAGPAEVAPPTPLPLRVRRSRNMFPCPVEVQRCNQDSDFIDSCVQAGEPKIMGDTHAEPVCLRCNRVRDESTRVEPEEAMLYTIRGRAKIHIGKWYCSTCELLVEYDGALNGLFVATRDTVYARTFLDAMLELCVIARSTMTAASEYLASLLRNTPAYGECEPGQARQLLSNACGEFSHTLIIPDAAFRCHLCGAEERSGGRFCCVICDGQVLSVL